MNNPYDIYKLLDKSNCRRCLLPSCLAFSVAVIQGEKKLQDCPLLGEEVLKVNGGNEKTRQTLEDDQQNIIETLKKEISTIDLSKAAERLSVPFRNGKIGINCLGKDFWIGPSGELSSECHANHWIYLPLLHYILYGKGTKSFGEWVNYGGLQGATKARAQYFSHRCEEPLRQLADAHSELLFEILPLFGAQKKEGITNADHSLAIIPLPNIPLIINYWEPEDDFPSQLTLLFDASTTDNLDLDSLYLISRGLVEMFRELIVKHSKDGKLFG